MWQLDMTVLDPLSGAVLSQTPVLELSGTGDRLPSCQAVLADSHLIVTIGAPFCVAIRMAVALRSSGGNRGVPPRPTPPRGTRRVCRPWSSERASSSLSLGVLDWLASTPKRAGGSCTSPCPTAGECSETTPNASSSRPHAQRASHRRR